MDVILMIVYCTIVLGFLVFIHEGGHFLAARAFGVRVTEFMIGLPGPSIGFTWKGTKFGITAVLLGGYARVCGMEPGTESPHLARVLAYAYERGTVLMDDVARDLNITEDEAYDALEEITEWGCVTRPTRKDETNIYRTVETKGLCAAGEPHPFEGTADDLYRVEGKQQYRNLPFIKRVVILLAGPGMNLLFAIVAFVLIYSVMGFDLQNTDTGEVTHMVVDPWRSIVAGFSYIGQVFVAIVGLFNPMTAADTVSNSTSIMGIAVMSKSAAEQGFESFLSFSAMLSVSLGLMNMLPIPPLDGGRFVVEIYQKIRGRFISYKALNYLSIAGILFFVGFFVIMLNQDVQRFIFNNW